MSELTTAQKRGLAAIKKSHQIHEYEGQKYNLVELGEKFGMHKRTVAEYLEEGYSVEEVPIIFNLRKGDGGMSQIETMKCRVCGMEFPSIKFNSKYRKRTCGKICTKMEKEYPEEFGLWWKN